MLGSCWNLHAWVLPTLQPSAHQKRFVWLVPTVLKLGPSFYNCLIRYPVPRP